MKILDPLKNLCFIQPQWGKNMFIHKIINVLATHSFNDSDYQFISWITILIFLPWLEIGQPVRLFKIFDHIRIISIPAALPGFKSFVIIISYPGGMVDQVLYGYTFKVLIGNIFCDRIFNSE